ncbi:aminopeptidase P family protein [Candidatus Bathyarchaeota archaeon]|nr:aminopeptidase P family protein [Candidatus Bathyarchaeota archaeon]
METMREFKERCARVRVIMDEKSVDALCLTPSADMYYLTGFWTDPAERPILCTLPRAGEPMFMVPRLYEEQVRQRSWIDDVQVWDEETGTVAQLRELLQKLKILEGKIAVPDRLWMSQFRLFQEAAPEADYVFTSEILGRMRMIKSEQEIRCMERAAQLAEAALAATFPLCREYSREYELAAHLEYEMRVKGAEGSAFETIVASGPNGSIPHHGSGDRKLRDGEFVTFDVGARLNRYCSDITRTVAVGKISPKMERVYNTVWKAYQEAVSAVKPGIASENVDLAARRVIVDSGYGEYFIHRTGHGVGLDIHEPPYIRQRDQTRLEAGMTFSIEPGVYIPGEFGVRIEDVVVVTEEGCRPLTKYPAEMIAV